MRVMDLLAVGIGGGLFLGASIDAVAFYAKSLGTPFFDWTFYEAAVDRWLAGAPIYPGQKISTLGAAAGSSYAYPPASVPLMVPFASWPLGALAWEALVVGTLVMGLWAVARVGWPNRPLLAFGLALATMAPLFGVMEGVAIGNVNIATAGLVGLVWAGSRGVVPVVGLMTVIKVFPYALSAPLGLGAMARAGAIAGVICLVTLPLVGIASWVDYFVALGRSVPLCGDPRWFNESLACALEPYTSVEMAKWSGLVAAGVLIVIAMLAGRTFVGIAAAGLAVMAPATELHAHYYAILYVLAWIALASANRLVVGRIGRQMAPETHPSSPGIQST